MTGPSWVSGTFFYGDFRHRVRICWTVLARGRAARFQQERFDYKNKSFPIRPGKSNSTYFLMQLGLINDFQV